MRLTEIRKNWSLGGFSKTLAVLAFYILPALWGCGRSEDHPIAAAPPAFTDLSDGPRKTQIEQLAALGVFDPVSGKFDPYRPVTRGEFVRWLFRANNAIWVNDADKQILAADGSRTTFPDVPPSQPDYKYIEGFVDAGFAIGFDDKLFHPTRPLTREQMIAIKESVDRAGVDSIFLQLTPRDLHGTYSGAFPNWKDREQIAPEYLAAIASDANDDRNTRNNSSLVPGATIDNVARTFGAIVLFYPKRAVTRAEAAICIWRVGPHDTRGTARSAADNLTATPKPSAAP